MKKAPRIYLLNAQVFGLDVLEFLYYEGAPIDGVFYLSHPKYETDKASGYIDSEEFLRTRNIRGVSLESYDLQSEKDKQKILSEKVDILVILGWQRLVPDWVIDHSRIATVSGHGSPFGISAGRGRSPQNWALILGKDSFELSLFRTKKGIDDGDVLLSETFQYEEDDDIRTSYLKSTLSFSRMVQKYIQCPEDFPPRAQIGPFYYLPQRMPEDGLIDWNQNSDVIARFVKALTNPYPGAFTKQGHDEIRIWKVRRLNGVSLQQTGKPGVIAYVSSQQEIIVESSDGFVVIEKWSSSGDWKPKTGEALFGENFSDQIKRITERHERKYPEHPLNPVFYEIMKVSKR